VKKEILASLTFSRPWRQVVSTNSWSQDVLIIKKHRKESRVKMSGVKSVASRRCRVRKQI